MIQAFHGRSYMIIRFLNYIFGYIIVEVYGEKKERFINLIRGKQIAIWKIRDIENGYRFYMYARDFKQLKDIIRKTRMKIKIKERYGLPFLLFKYRKRKAFALGIITAFIICYGMSLFVWDISVEGNYSYTKYEILDFLKENQVYHGMKKEDADCEEIEKKIRNNYFDITWVSVELKGTRLIVHLKENFDDAGLKEQPLEEYEDGKGYMLVSDKDAVIESIITRTGKPMVKMGQQVSAGDVLIDGKFDIQGDYEEYIRTEYVVADGDVYGQVVYDYNEETEREYINKKYTGEETSYTRLRLNDRSVELGIGSMEYKNYDKIEEENQLSIVGDFYVPFYMDKIVYREYENESLNYTDDELKNIETVKLSYFLENLLKKGIQIKENNVTIEIGEDKAVASGSIITVEKLGVLEPVSENVEENEEIKDNNE